MTVLYIAGPMYGLPEKNYPMFQWVEGLLIDAGHSVISPLEADKFVLPSDPEPTREWWQRITMRLLLNTEAVALLDGWEDSKGAMLEVVVAEGLGMTVAPYREWLEQ